MHRLDLQRSNNALTIYPHYLLIHSPLQICRVPTMPWNTIFIHPLYQQTTHNALQYPIYSPLYQQTTHNALQYPQQTTHNALQYPQQTTHNALEIPSFTILNDIDQFLLKSLRSKPRQIPIITNTIIVTQTITLCCFPSGQFYGHGRNYR